MCLIIHKQDAMLKFSLIKLRCEDIGNIIKSNYQNYE